MLWYSKPVVILGFIFILDNLVLSNHMPWWQCVKVSCWVTFHSKYNSPSSRSCLTEPINGHSIVLICSMPFCSICPLLRGCFRPRTIGDDNLPTSYLPLKLLFPPLTSVFSPSLHLRWRAAAGAWTTGEADSASARLRGGGPAEAGPARAGSGLDAGAQPAAGGRAAAEEGLRGEGGAAAERAGSAPGGVREEGDAGAAAAHATGAGAEKPQGATGEEQEPLRRFVSLLYVF